MTKRLSPIKQNSWKLLLALFWACLWLSAGARAEASQETYPPFEDGDVVGFIGDSITHVTYRSQGYVDMLEEYYLSRFPGRDVEFRNLGADGHKITDFLKIYDSDPAFRGLSRAVIMLGTNEAILKIAPEEYIGNMETLVARLKEDGLAGEDILILSSPICDQNCSKNFDKNGNMRWTYEGRLLEYLELLETKTAEWGVGYLNLHTPMAELTEEIQREDASNTLTTDCIHPNALGHRLIAFYILQAQGEGTAPLSEIAVPQKGEPQMLRGKLTDFYRGQKGLCGTYHPETLPMAAAGDVAEFQAFYEAGALMCQMPLRVEGLDAAASYTVWLDETELGSFTGEELEAGIDLATLETHPLQPVMEQINALSRKRHQALAKHRNMWVEVMMQRASFTQEQIDASYRQWRENDERLRAEMRALATEAAEGDFALVLLEEGYPLEELKQEQQQALELQKALELAMKEVEALKADFPIHRYLEQTLRRIRQALPPLRR